MMIVFANQNLGPAQAAFRLTRGRGFRAALRCTLLMLGAMPHAAMRRRGAGGPAGAARCLVAELLGPSIR